MATELVVEAVGGIGAEDSSPHRSLVPVIGEQIIGDDAMCDHR
jgi:hypothetical protein